MEKSNYLKDELYNLIQSDISIFEFIQSGSLDGIWYWDLENPENEWMSPRFWEVIGYDPNEMKPLASEWQNIIFQDDLQIATKNFQQHLADPNHPYDQTVRYKHKNGSTVWVRCRGIAIRDKDGKPVRLLGAHNDITTIMNMKCEIEELNRNLMQKVNEDYLTKLLNRRGLEERYHHLIEMAKRDEFAVSIAMFDVDFFKQVNDVYGHEEGDETLIQVSKILLDASRESDVVGRYGGEEFIILMPQSNKEEAILGAERIRLFIQNHKVGISENLTISCGLATSYPSKNDNVLDVASTLLEYADKALYYSKMNGRNQVKHYDDLV